MDKGLLIGLIGNKRVGKDTSANILVDKYDFTKLAFADPIKQIISLLFDVDVSENIDKEVPTEYDVSLREFYQKFGTDLMHEDIYKYFPKLEKHIPKKMFWVLKTFRSIEKYKKEGKNKFVISDVRFIHEAKYIKENGGLLVKITCDNIDIGKDKHISETEINLIPENMVDYKINNKTIEVLDNDITFYINELLYGGKD